MTKHFRLAAYGVLALAAIACSPDRLAAPREQRPAHPATSISNLKDLDPIIYDRSSTNGTLSGVASFRGAHQAAFFGVPPGEVYTITQVVISGALRMTTLPFAIRINRGGPDDIIQSYDLAPTQSDASPCGCTSADGTPVNDYLFTLPTPLTLWEDNYWLTVGPIVGFDPDAPAQFEWQVENADATGLKSLDGGTWERQGSNAFVLTGLRRAAQTITFPAITPSPAALSSSATLGASASSGLAVDYTSLTPDVCSVSGTTVAYNTLGVCTVAADQAGNPTFGPATQATQSVDVVKAPQTITFTSTPPAPGYVKGTYVVAATGGASGNAVMITVGSPNVCTVAGNTVRFVGVGICTVTANQAGNDNYTAAVPTTQTIKVDYRFDGFLGSVKNNGVLNTVNAGQVIPLQWRIIDASGAPITTLASVTITVADLNCALGTASSQVAQQPAGSSGLQNLGNGYYQYNWRSPANLAKSCKTLQLGLGEGSGPRTARFAFTK